MLNLLIEVVRNLQKELFHPEGNPFENAKPLDYLN